MSVLIDPIPPTNLTMCQLCYNCNYQLPFNVTVNKADGSFNYCNTTAKIALAADNFTACDAPNIAIQTALFTICGTNACSITNATRIPSANYQCVQTVTFHATGKIATPSSASRAVVWISALLLTGLIL